MDGEREWVWERMRNLNKEEGKISVRYGIRRRNGGKSEREWLREKKNKDLRKRGEIREEKGKENGEKLRGWKANKGRK